MPADGIYPVQDEGQRVQANNRILQMGKLKFSPSFQTIYFRESGDDLGLSLDYFRSITSNN